MFTVVLRILTMLGSSVSFIKFMNRNDNEKELAILQDWIKKKRAVKTNTYL